MCSLKEYTPGIRAGDTGKGILKSPIYISEHSEKSHLYWRRSGIRAGDTGKGSHSEKSHLYWPYICKCTLTCQNFPTLQQAHADLGKEKGMSMTYEKAQILKVNLNWPYTVNILGHWLFIISKRNVMMQSGPFVTGNPRYLHFFSLKIYFFCWAVRSLQGIPGSISICFPLKIFFFCSAVGSLKGISGSLSVVAAPPPPVCVSYHVNTTHYSTRTILYQSARWRLMREPSRARSSPSALMPFWPRLHTSHSRYCVTNLCHEHWCLSGPGFTPHTQDMYMNPEP